MTEKNVRVQKKKTNLAHFFFCLQRSCIILTAVITESHCAFYQLYLKTVQAQINLLLVKMTLNWNEGKNKSVFFTYCTECNKTFPDLFLLMTLVNCLQRFKMASAKCFVKNIGTWYSFELDVENLPVPSFKSVCWGPCYFWEWWWRRDHKCTILIQKIMTEMADDSSCLVWLRF